MIDDTHRVPDLRDIVGERMERFCAEHVEELEALNEVLGGNLQLRGQPTQRSDEVGVSESAGSGKPRDEAI